MGLWAVFSTGVTCVVLVVALVFGVAVQLFGARGAVVGLLGLFRRYRLWRLAASGSSEEDEAGRRIVSGDAWNDFCDTLKAAGAALVHDGAPQDVFNQAEGYRYLTRITRAGLEAFIEYADPNAPVLHRVVHEKVKMGSDNPDNYYQTACIDGGHEYRIVGRRNTVAYLAFGTQIGHYGRSGGLPPAGFLEASEMTFGEDGSFEIVLSQKEQGQNWLRMTPDTYTLVVRQTFLDRATEKVADLRIERLSGATLPVPITAKMVDDGLKDASTLVAGASMLFARWAKGFQAHSNKLPRFDQETSNKAGGDPNIAYYHSHWRLAANEALVITAMPPECAHWNFQLNNYWMESLDYEYHQIHVNKFTAKYRTDGSVCIIVAHRDPGVPDANWIRTLNHNEGTMCFRWVRGASQPEPSTRVVAHPLGPAALRL